MKKIINEDQLDIIKRKIGDLPKLYQLTEDTTDPSNPLGRDNCVPEKSESGD